MDNRNINWKATNRHHRNYSSVDLLSFDEDFLSFDEDFFSFDEDFLSFDEDFLSFENSKLF
jgi:hypothetical protein